MPTTTPCETSHVTQPDGTITFTVVSDCPGGFPVSKPIYVGPSAAAARGHSNGIALGIIVGAVVVLGAFAIFGHHSSPPPIPHIDPPQFQIHDAPAEPSGKPVS